MIIACAKCGTEKEWTKNYFRYHKENGSTPAYLALTCLDCDRARMRKKYYTDYRKPLKLKKPKPEMWTCNKCKEIKPFTLEFFYPCKKGVWGIQKTCKQCYCKQSNENRFRRLYGRNKGFLDRFKARKGCEVCGRCDVRMCQDHNHMTGKLRGVLCNGCNTALGMVRENVSTLKGLIEYLIRYNTL